MKMNNDSDLVVGVIKKSKRKTVTRNGVKITERPPIVVELFEYSKDLKNDLYSIFDKIDQQNNLNCVEYSPDYHKESDELYFLSDYELPEQITKFLNNPLSVAKYKPSNALDISSLFIGTPDCSCIAFVKIEDRQFLSNKKVNILCDNGTFTKYSKPGIVLDPTPDFYYKDGKLFFESFKILNSVLDVDEYYEMATNEGVTEFVNNDCLSIQDEIEFRSKLDNYMKRQILLIEKRGILKKDTGFLINLANSKGLNLQIKDNRIVLPADKKQIKVIMGFLAGKVYKDEMTDETYLANSVSKINRP